jgi:hypothetical protein
MKPLSSVDEVFELMASGGGEASLRCCTISVT